MNKKIIPVLLVMLATSLFIGFRSQGRNDEDDNPKNRYAKILRNIGVLLEEGHFSPRKIDDNFSKDVFKKFTEDLDGEKNILLQTDIEEFRKFETRIDDEIHGSDLQSFFAMNEVYLKRLNEVSGYYTEILSKPFEFNTEESILLDGEKLSFPKNEKERNDMWRKRLKYQVLGKYVDLQEEREKNKDKKDFVVKPDSTLEREARDIIRKQIVRYFSTKKNRETADENFSTFVNAITGTMDPHTTYFPPVDLRSFNESMSGRFYGIGAQLKEDDGKIKIVSLVTGGPAWKSGEIKENDEILKVGQGSQEPVDVTGFAVSEAVKLIKGSEKGSEVRLTVRRIDGTIKQITLIRDEIKLEDTFAKSAIVKSDYKIGYIYLPEFYVDFERANGARCSEDVAKEIEKLKAEKVDGIVLDLRGNGGGSLPEVVKMVGLFIEEGPVCQVKGRDDKPSLWKDLDKRVLYTGPLAVMVDETSASASEIFAAAIQDYKRGIVIGSTSTFGKGTVQRNIPLNPENEINIVGGKKSDELGSVKLTLQKFYRINGGATQLKGVTPDVIIPDRLEYLKFREKDNPYALKWDEISKADYKTWTSTVSADAFVMSANNEVNRNTTFGKIKTNVQWLEKYNDKEYSLNIVKYKQEQKELKRVYKEIEDLYKLSKPLDIHNIETDLVAINAAKEKAEKNKQWLKRVGDDIYVDESIKILSKMITQNNLAKAN
jgi:carboxyl-terminal processing protease